MEVKRTPFQGVSNIIRFNYHFYVITGLLLITARLAYPLLPPLLQTVLLIGIISVLLTVSASLIVSFYIYDLSGIYNLSWLHDLNGKKILNVNAGFDETSGIIQRKFPGAALTICDFYNAETHTEISIKRARRMYPPPSKTIPVQTDHFPFPDTTFSTSIVIFSAHEIRNEQERILFFKELSRVTHPSGQIIVTEHLRDLTNFMAYSIGSMHFHSKKTWYRTFEKANLNIVNELKSTPFITTFILKKDGITV